MYALLCLYHCSVVQVGLCSCSASFDVPEFLQRSTYVLLPLVVALLLDQHGHLQGHSSAASSPGGTGPGHLGEETVAEEGLAVGVLGEEEGEHVGDQDVEHVVERHLQGVQQVLVQPTRQQAAVHLALLRLLHQAVHHLQGQHAVSLGKDCLLGLVGVEGLAGGA